jgi:rubrerythrin
MPAPFNADEVFEIACRIEQNGIRFYKRAAEYELDSEVRELLQRLATMEEQHLQVFRRMRGRLDAGSPNDWEFDFRDQAAQYLHAVADGHVFDTTDPSEKLTGEETAGEIIDMAIGLEKETVVFYSGIQSAMTGELGRDEVGEIIRQELAHVAALSGLAGRREQ